MTDKELADRAFQLSGLSSLELFPNGWIANDVITDWRVAGAMLQMLTWDQATEIFKNMRRLRNTKIKDPRPIIEACVAYLEYEIIVAVADQVWNES